VDSIDAGYAVDNLSFDRDGNIFAAAIPDSIKFFAHTLDPYNRDTPTTALKVAKKAEGGYEFTKAIEDGLAEILPGATTVLHDAETGRMFFSGKLVAESFHVCKSLTNFDRLLCAVHFCLRTEMTH
jgi:hypothetical protein